MPTESVKEAIFATKQERKNLLNVGGPGAPVKTFKKSDFLDPDQFAKKFGINKELVVKTMKKLAMQNAKFIINGHFSNIVVRTPDDKLLAHPMALDEINKRIENQKVRS